MNAKEMPKEIKEKALEVVSASRARRKGVNEVTKSIERKKAKLVVVAEDVSPQEIVMHLPKLAQEKGIPCVYVESKEALGKAAGINGPTSSVAIEDMGNDALLSDLVKRLPKHEEHKK